MSAQQYLDDANLVAQYGVRIGAFAPDEPLLSALAAAQAAAAANPDAPPGLGSPEVTAVQRALPAAVRLVQPISLQDLRDGWTVGGYPAGSAGALATGDRTKWTFGVLVATVLVMFACGYFTIWQQRASTIVTEIAQNKRELRSIDYAALFPLIAAIGSDDEVIFDPSVSARLGLFNLHRKIETIEKAILQDMKSYAEARERFAIFGRVGDYAASGGRTVAALLARATSPWGGTATAEAPAVAAASKIAEPVDLVAQAEERCGALKFDVAEMKAKLGQAPDLVLRYVAASEHEAYLINTIRCGLGLGKLEAAARMKLPEEAWDLDYESGLDVSQMIGAFGVWILPALYGMLGALVYHIRIYLGDDRPNPGRMKVVLRVFLGGFAGVAIGWFWSPGSGGGGPAITDITLTTLSVAFVVGFSVDVFLTLLDRVVTILDGWARGLGGAPAR